LRLCADNGIRMASEWQGNLVVATPRSVAELASTRIIARRVERIGQRPGADATAPGGIARLFIRFGARGSAPLRGSAPDLDTRSSWKFIDWNAPGFAALEVMAVAHRVREPHRVRLILLSALSSEPDVGATSLNPSGSPLPARPASIETGFSFLLFHTMFHA